MHLLKVVTCGIPADGCPNHQGNCQSLYIVRLPECIFDSIKVRWLDTNIWGPAVAPLHSKAEQRHLLIFSILKQ
jgi:hypothetical protein